jgi:hypothetical protein
VSVKKTWRDPIKLNADVWAYVSRSGRTLEIHGYAKGGGRCAEGTIRVDKLLRELKARAPRQRRG